MAEDMAHVDVVHLDGTLVVRVHGEVDLSNAEEIGKALEEATGERRARHVIDLTETNYFDSAGIRLLFLLATRLQERRQELIVVAPASGVVRRVLELTDIRRLVTVVSTLEEVADGAGS